MKTSRDDIWKWLMRGREIGATHLIVRVDSFDEQEYPLYVMTGQDAAKLAEETGTQTTAEVYNMSLDLEAQLNDARTYNL